MAYSTYPIFYGLATKKKVIFIISFYGAITRLKKKHYYMKELKLQSEWLQLLLNGKWLKSQCKSGLACKQNNNISFFKRTRSDLQIYTNIHGWNAITVVSHWLVLSSHLFTFLLFLCAVPVFSDFRTATKFPSELRSHSTAETLLCHRINRFAQEHFGEMGT